jgi:MFS family permease
MTRVEHEPLPEQAAALAGAPTGGYRELFRRNPDFTKLYFAQLISFGGDWFASVAILTLVIQKTRSPALAALVIAAQTLPFAIVSPFAGVIVDRFDRKTVMISADVIRAVVALGFLAGQTQDTIWILFVCEILISAFSAFFEPASSAALPNLVRPADLARANVLMGAAWGTMLVVGAALGGLVSAVFGNTAAFIGDSASFAISAAFLLSIGGRFHEKDPDPDRSLNVVEDVRETIAFARKERRVLALLVVKAGFGISAGVIGLVSIFAVQVFRGAEGTVGLLMSARGVGALTGPFFARRWARGRTDRMFTALSVAGSVFAIGYGIFAVAPSSWVAAVGACIAHIGGGSIWTLSTYGLQRFTPDHIRGRVFSFDYGLVTLTIAGSAFFAGAAAERADPRTVMGGIAAFALGLSFVWTIWRRRLLRETATAPEA